MPWRTWERVEVGSTGKGRECELKSVTERSLVFWDDREVS